jgi:4-amino-4-deoxy-L-arabinose transferase-like glycosyltransferase
LRRRAARVRVDLVKVGAVYLKQYKIIVPLLIFAAALRIIGAGSYPVWTDEGWSIWAAGDPTQVIAIVAADRHPPLYFAALSVWEQAAGDSYIALRFLSIAAGMLLVAVVYRLAADAFGRRAGLYAVLLIATLPIAVYYAQEVRHYGWLALFSAISWLVFLRYLKRPSRARWIGYVLSLSAMFYTLYFGAFTLAVQGIVLTLLPLSTKWRGGWGVRFRALFGAWLVTAILYLPWAYVIVTQQAGILGSGISGFPGTLDADDIVGTLRIVFSTQLIIPLAAFALGTWAMLRRPSLQRIAQLLGGGGLLLAMFALSVKFDFLAARTLVFVTPLLMVVCGAGLSQIDLLPKRTGLSFTVSIGAVLTIVWVILILTMAPIIQPRLDSGTAARALATAYQSGDAVILEAGWDDNAFAYEIEQALPKGAEITRTLPWTNDRTGGAPVVPQIEPILQSHRRVWVVQWLQAAQVLPYLQSGGDGFQAAQSLDVSAGDYGARFSAPTIQIRLFTR